MEGKNKVMESVSVNALDHKNIELKSNQCVVDATLFKLLMEKKELEAGQPLVKKPPSQIVSRYNYIHPLVEEIYLLELREKELKEQYHDKQLAAEARLLGQQLISASLSKEETVLKLWYEELLEVQSSQLPLSTKSAESQDFAAVHNIVYDCKYYSDSLREDLAFTVLRQAVHARLTIHSVLTCFDIHHLSCGKAEVTVSCDNHIPKLEETVLQSLEHNSTIQGVISKIGEYIATDMAPFVISIPMKKKSKKKKQETFKAKLCQAPEEHGESSSACVQNSKDG